ncbi:MAG: response regulator transcription factor [Sphingobacteriia bacterium]|nr:response regulator transcription factor [Sphingobacteriia bacterium]
MESIKLIVVDDHQIIRDGIRSMLAGQTGITIIGEASSGIELFKLLDQNLPDVILMDISLPGKSGIELARQIKAHAVTYKIQILFLSMFLQEEYIQQAIKAGASGYLPKNVTQQELTQAIKQLAEGKDYYADEISKIIFKSFLNKNRSPEADNRQKELSIRELDILRLVATGYNNQQIADQLFISIRTVETHKNHIMQKLELHSTADLIKYAIRHKLTEV